jgi:GTPase SAR1 family protein
MAGGICGCFGGTKDKHQIFLFGPEDGGKTTLLYHLKLPDWKKEDLASTIHRLKGKGDKAEDRKFLNNRDPGYHYEEFTLGGNLGKYGLWDVPGFKEMQPMWPMYYRYINVTAVLFIVNGSRAWAEKTFDTDGGGAAKETWQDKFEDFMAKTKHQLEFMLNEDELRLCAFFLIINDHGEKDADWEHVIKLSLNAYEIQEQPWNSQRFRMYTMNVAEVHERGSTWKEILNEIYKIYISYGGGKE